MKKRNRNNPKRDLVEKLVTEGKLDVTEISERASCDRLYVTLVAKKLGVKVRCTASPNRSNSIATVPVQQNISDARLALLYDGRRYDAHDVVPVYVRRAA